MLRTVARLRRSAYGNLQQLVGHQRDVGGLERRVAAGGAHGDADVGGRQRRRVVDAVADHRHRSVAAAQLLDGRDLVFGQQLGAELVDAELGARSRARWPALSPVSMTTRLDALLAAAGRPRRGRFARGRSATAMMPSGSPSRATSTGVRPARASSSRRVVQRRRAQPALLEQPVVAEQRRARRRRGLRRRVPAAP